MNGDRALRALRCSFCAFIVFASSQAFMAGLTGNGERHHLAAHGLLALSGVEVLAALALLIPGLALAAAWVLCAVFAIAAVLTLAAGEVPLRFVYYAATAISLGLAKRPCAVAAGCQ
jgi:hypothetical protein